MIRFAWRTNQQFWCCFSLRCNPFFEIWICKTLSERTNEVGPAWQTFAGNHHIPWQKIFAFSSSDPRDTFENKLNDLKPLYIRKKSFAFQNKLKKMLLHWRENLADQNKQQPQEINMRITYHTWPLSVKQTFDRHMSIWLDYQSQSSTAFAGERRFSKSMGLSASVSFLSLPLPSPSFIFWLSFHFSRGQSRKSSSSVFLCSETRRKRLLRRLFFKHRL